jgi:hypothetical protein
LIVARRADRFAKLALKISRAHLVKVAIAANPPKEPDLARVEQVGATNPAVRVPVNVAA